jgi:antitoxin component HigA of HigAB toxin-antitoxin module
MTPDTWLTLSQLARKTDLSESRLQRLVSKLGPSLGGRNFGDIVKYPAAVTETIVIIADLYQQGWSSEEIIELLDQDSCCDQAPEVPTLDKASVETAITLVENYEQLSKLLLSTIGLVNNLLSTTAILHKRLADLEKEIKSLKRETQIIRRFP